MRARGRRDQARRSGAPHKQRPKHARPGQLRRGQFASTLQEWRRAVFTAYEEREDRARDVLAEYDWGEPDLYLYDKLGDMHDQKAFRMAMLTAMERRVNAGSGASKTGLVSSEGA